MKSALAKVPKNGLASYSELKHRVREAFARGRERAEAAVDREKVRTAWEVGKLIQEHILLNKARADYGKRIIHRLSAELGTSHTELKYMLEFAHAYPIGPTSGQLSWSHYRDLLAINESQKRDELARRAAKGKWTINETRREIKKLKTENPSAVDEPLSDEPLIPIKGKLDTYRIVTATVGPWKGRPAVDLGFSSYFPLPASLWFREGEILHLPQDVVVVREARLGILKEANPADLFTYRGYLVDAHDADTPWMVISLGLGFITTQKLRLRGIDAPEINTRAGREAKRFVERVLRKAKSITISTSKSDKYDRYLADVFYEKKGKEIFLNQELLDRGYAVRVKE